MVEEPLQSHLLLITLVQDHSAKNVQKNVTRVTRMRNTLKGLYKKNEM